jgi:tetratricopeptide (TPR) repeat protein
MRKGRHILAGVAVLACSACLGSGGKLEIRPSATVPKPGRESVPYRIAEARGQLAIGNVALALEGFRKAAREDPASAAALAGVADCYDRMGRFDLSRRHYEMALAITPRDPQLLGALAASLDRQGQPGEAAAVRREMAALVEPPVIAASAESAPDETAIAASTAALADLSVAAPVGQSVTVVLPPARPVESPKTAAAPLKVAPVVPVGRSVTIALPPPRPAPNMARSPRLERLSLTEVALITGSGVRWKRPAMQAAESAVRPLSLPKGGLRLLNAARVDRLAARTQAYLGRFGWRDIIVGDAGAVRTRSLILYPRQARSEAAKLSARLGIAMAPRSDIRQLTVLLGRDAAAHPALRPKA